MDLIVSAPITAEIWLLLLLLFRMTNDKLNLTSLPDARSILAKVSPVKEKETLQDAFDRLKQQYSLSPPL